MGDQFGLAAAHTGLGRPPLIDDSPPNAKDAGNPLHGSADDIPLRSARLASALALSLALLLPLHSPTASAEPQVKGSQVGVEAGDVQQYLAGAFPQTHDALGGLLELTVSHPKLALPPGNRLDLGFDLAMATAGGAPMPVGNVGLSGALRYDAATQGFFLDQPTVDRFTPAQAGGKLDSRTRELLNVWLADYARREPSTSSTRRSPA